MRIKVTSQAYVPTSSHKEGLLKELAKHSLSYNQNEDDPIESVVDFEMLGVAYRAVFLNTLFSDHRNEEYCGLHINGLKMIVVAANYPFFEQCVAHELTHALAWEVYATYDSPLGAEAFARFNEHIFTFTKVILENRASLINSSTSHTVN